ncbi:MAG: chromosomal replication initiator protein DnaA [Betaproteobacteria bacterium]|jgi:chromosomal replication initiator protein
MESLWQDCLLHFERELPGQQFQTWFKPLALLRIDQNGQSSRVVLSAPTRFKQSWAKNQFSSALSAWWSSHLGTPVELEIEINGQSAQPGHPEPAPTAGATSAPPKPETTGAPPEPAVSQSRLNADWNFETFVPGKANQLARAAALQVADNPGKGYNPLFIYGGVGLGKSHLIHAVGNALMQRNPNARARYIHAEAYVSDVVRAYQRKSFDEFKRYYHSLDLLLIDDIQFFAGKQRTQEEFFYAFEALIAAQKQIIITSDTYPTELGEINPRLLTRFSSGLTVAIEPPELEMRVAILMKKAEIESFVLPEEEAFFVAKQLRSNVRELEGALKKIIAYCDFHGCGPSNETVREALKDILSLQKTLISVENIQKSVADFYNIKVADMYSKRRPANIAMPRQIAMYLAKELTQKSFPEIGDLFGGRDHTTVLHAVKKVSDLRLRNAELNHQLHVLEQQLRG